MRFIRFIIKKINSNIENNKISNVLSILENLVSSNTPGKKNMYSIKKLFNFLIFRLFKFLHELLK